MATARFDSDIIIVGGGPAGLATAIHAALRGISAMVLERALMPVDKACGEGLMPGGVHALSAMKALQFLNPADYTPFAGIRYLQEDGLSIEARFRNGHGIGIRRTALTAALAMRAAALGVELVSPCRVENYQTHADKIVVTTDRGDLTAQLLVAADGLNSRLRREAGLEIAARAPRRFGMRQHFAIAPWSEFVEVYWSDGIEAYVTPAGAQRVGIAFLWDDRRAREVLASSISFELMLKHFPPLAARLAGIAIDSKLSGAGPLARATSRVIADRFVLIGDAAGYLDAITGEGLSLAFNSAASLATALAAQMPQPLTRQSCQIALAEYEKAYLQAYRRYQWPTRGLLFFSRYPRLRRATLHLLAAWPGSFEQLLAGVGKQKLADQLISG